MTHANATSARLCDYIRRVEAETGKRVTAARIEGRAIVLEFGQAMGVTVNPADLVDMTK
ncbi:hypothetical protein [Roseovarius sp.]